MIKRYLKFAINREVQIAVKLKGRPKFMGYPGWVQKQGFSEFFRVLKRGAKTFFGSQKSGEETFLDDEKRGLVFSSNKIGGHYFFFLIRKGAANFFTPVF